MRAAVEGNAEDRGAAVRQVVRIRNAHEGEGTDEEIVVVDIMPAAVHLPPSSFIQRAQNTPRRARTRSEEHTSELQSLMRISYAVFCLKKKNNKYKIQSNYHKNVTRKKRPSNTQFNKHN